MNLDDDCLMRFVYPLLNDVGRKAGISGGQYPLAPNETRDAEHAYVQATSLEIQYSTVSLYGYSSSTNNEAYG